MGNAPDIPPEELNLTHMRTITALVGSMQRVQLEVDEIGRQSPRRYSDRGRHSIW
jgi:hypothetical protein